MVTSPGCISASLLMTPGIDDPLTQTRNKWRLEEMRWKDFPPRAGLQINCVVPKMSLRDRYQRKDISWVIFGWME